MATSSNPKDFIINSPTMFSVEELMKGPTMAIPQQFIRSDQPLSSSLNSPLPAPTPAIDMTRLLSADDDISNFELQKLHSTCKNWGIFQLVNHGVRSSVMEKLKHEVEGFFKLSLEERMKFKIKEGELEGYGSRERGGGKYDWVDSLNIITNPLHRRRPHLFPELPSSLRNTLESYIWELQQLATKLLTLIAKALKIDRKEIIELFDDGLQALRLACYPPCPQPELVMALTPHSDITLLTFLHQVNGVDGLHIKKDGLWFPFHVNPDAFVVNVGDVLQIYSNGVYHSVEHKVSANAEKERISIAFTINPKFEADVGPSPSLTSNPNNPPLFRKVGMEQYLKGFFTHNKYGKSYLDYMRIQDAPQHTST